MTEQLKRAILLGHFKPGEKLLSERDLPEEFQVSRLPIREAFLALFLPNKISIPELHHDRVLIEPEVGRLAALHITPEYSERLREALKIEELPIPSLSVDIERIQRIHLILAEMSGNRFFRSIGKITAEAYKKSRRGFKS